MVQSEQQQKHQQSGESIQAEIAATALMVSARETVGIGTETGEQRQQQGGERLEKMTMVERHEKAGATGGADQQQQQQMASQPEAMLMMRNNNNCDAVRTINIGAVAVCSPTTPPITTTQQQQIGNNSSANVNNSNNGSNTIKVGFYEVDRTIGKGNYAVVKLARHRITKTEVAIKIVDKRRLDANNLAKVYREIEVLKKLRHPNIVRLYQVMETSNMLYLVTEYAPNGEIFDLISKLHRLSEDSAREKFWQIISAVDYLHNMGIVHRDLKAENLLLDAGFKIKLADFGFSNFYTPFDTLNTFCGSPPYAAPEVFEGKRYAGPEIDIWSLGVILYVMVCGALPFEGVNLQLLRDRVLSGRIRIPYFMSTECENLIRRMLTVDPRRRPTIEQIKQHKWMRRAQFGTKYEQQQQIEAPPFTPGGTAQQQQQEPHPQILRIMNNIGIESHKVRNALLTDAYDNFQAIYLLLLERLQQRGGSLSPSQSSSQANTMPPATAAQQANQQQQQQQQQQSQLITTPTTIVQNAQQQQSTTNAAIAIVDANISNNNAAATGLQTPTTKIAPAVVLTTSPINPTLQQQQQQQQHNNFLLQQLPLQHQRLFRSVNARRQSDGVAIVGGGLVPCQCCCCTAVLQQPIGGGGGGTIPGNRRLPQALHAANTGIMTRPGAIAMAAAAAQQHSAADQPYEQQPQQHHFTHQHASTSDYESENGAICSGSSAAGSTLSRQSTIGTINSFDEGIPDDPNAGSGLLMFGGCTAMAAAFAQQQQHQPQSHPLFSPGGHDQLPSFDSQLSQDPLFSSQSSNNSAVAFRMDSVCGTNSNGGVVVGPVAGAAEHANTIGCCCSSASSSGGGTGDNLLRHVQLHPHCGTGDGGHHQHQYYYQHHHLLAAAHGHYHQHLLKPYWYPPRVVQQQQQQQQIHSARAAAIGDHNFEDGQQRKLAQAGEEQQQQQNHLLLFANQWRASDNAIGDDSLTFPTGQLGRCSRALPEHYKPFLPTQPPMASPAAAGGVGMQLPPPNLYNQFHRMRISTGMATFFLLPVPLAVGITASPILSASCTPRSGQCSPTGSINNGQHCVGGTTTTAMASSPPPSGLDKQSSLQSAGRHQAQGGCLPKRISLPENLEFQPQMLLNLKQSIHVEKQLTGSPDDPSATEMVGFEKPMMLKASTRLQQYQHQQQQKRKAARLQLLRQQSYHMAQKQSVIAGSSAGSPTAMNFHAQPYLQIQTSSPVQKNFSTHNMDGDGAAGDFGDSAATTERIPLSPIEDLKAEEVMDTS